jgi:hypothetical protein
MSRLWLSFGTALLLVSCSENEGVGGLTAEESDQLNDAAAMLDEPPPATVNAPQAPEEQ